MKTILSLVTVLAITGCGLKIETGGPAARSGLLGKWKSQCVGKSIMTFDFQTESSVVFKQDQYYDDTCTDPRPSDGLYSLSYHLDESTIVLGDNKPNPVRAQYTISGSNRMYLTMSGIGWVLDRQ